MQLSVHINDRSSQSRKNTKSYQGHIYFFSINELGKSVIQTWNELVDSRIAYLGKLKRDKKTNNVNINNKAREKLQK